MSQDVGPWNERFATELREPAFATREALGTKDARTLARELLAMSQADFSAAFKGPPMKRPELRGLKRNAAVVLGNGGTAEDVDVLTRALNAPEPLVREHAAWALGRLGSPGGAALRGHVEVEADAAVRGALVEALEAPTR
jgi:epoxyqueuosine reductase